MKQTYLILGIILVLVLAGALFAWEKKGENIEPAPVSPIQPLPVIPTTLPTPTQPTSYPLQPTHSSSTPYQKPEGWKTYENKEFGFALEYPNNLEIVEGETGYTPQIKGHYINFILPSGPSIIFAVEIFNAKLNETAVQVYSRITELDLTAFSKTKIRVAGIDADYYTNLPSEGGGASREEILLVHDNKFYGIVHYIYEDDKIFNLILSTFRFLR